MRQVDKVSINWEAAYASRYKILTSTDGTSYSLAAEVTISKAGWKTTPFSARQARYVKVEGVTRSSIYGISFWDVRVGGPADTPTEKAAGRPTTASSNHSATYTSAKAVDGSSSTRWSSTFTNNQWWQVDLGRAAPGRQGLDQLGERLCLPLQDPDIDRRYDVHARCGRFDHDTRAFRPPASRRAPRAT